MKNFIFFCFTIAISTIAQAQITIQVLDNETKENIEFASILLPEHKKSFVANEHGKFLIDTNKYTLPLKVIVERFGFESKEITLQNVTNLYNIYLNPTSELLREVIIPPKNAKIKERTYGRTNENIGKMKGESNYTAHNQSQIESNEEFGMIINTNNNLKPEFDSSLGFISLIIRVIINKEIYFYQLSNKWQPTSPFSLKIARYFFLKNARISLIY